VFAPPALYNPTTTDNAHLAPEPDDGRFHVKLVNFDGPFDLLLSLISRRQLDITEREHRMSERSDAPSFNPRNRPGARQRDVAGPGGQCERACASGFLHWAGHQQRLVVHQSEAGTSAERA
jgi:hypothetical protein